MEINFKEMTQFLGRNGYFKSKGIRVRRSKSDNPNYARETIRIYPITSKEEEGRCFVEVPIENLIPFIKGLQAIAEGD